MEEAIFDDNILVKELIDNFTAKGLEIQYANYGGYPKPKLMKNHRPDIVGWDNEKQLCHIGITKTNLDKIKDATTSEQLYEFSNFIMSIGKSEGKSCPFCIAVPKKHLTTLEQRLVDLGIYKRKNIQILEV